MTAFLVSNWAGILFGLVVSPIVNALITVAVAHVSRLAPKG